MPLLHHEPLLNPNGQRVIAQNIAVSVSEDRKIYTFWSTRSDAGRETFKMVWDAEKAEPWANKIIAHGLHRDFGISMPRELTTENWDIVCAQRATVFSKCLRQPLYKTPAKWLPRLKQTHLLYIYGWSWTRIGKMVGVTAVNAKLCADRYLKLPKRTHTRHATPEERRAARLASLRRHNRTPERREKNITWCRERYQRWKADAQRAGMSVKQWRKTKNLVHSAR